MLTKLQIQRLANEGLSIASSGEIADFLFARLGIGKQADLIAEGQRLIARYDIEKHLHNWEELIRGERDRAAFEALVAHDFNLAARAWIARQKHLHGQNWDKFLGYPDDEFLRDRGHKYAIEVPVRERAEMMRQIAF